MDLCPSLAHSSLNIENCQKLEKQSWVSCHLDTDSGVLRK